MTGYEEDRVTGRQAWLLVTQAWLLVTQAWLLVTEGEGV